jgi:murein L,D-transpeptidase YafK
MYSQSKTFLRDSVTIFNPKTKYLFSLLIFFAFKITGMSQSSIKQEQQLLSRVKGAYQHYQDQLSLQLTAINVDFSNIEIYVRAYKYEQTLEIFIRKKGTEKFIRLIEFPFCVLSGTLGPKRKQGDLQVPEGIYYIDRFNPWSNFHLSLGINYPNTFDKANALQNNPGGDIFIHGNCVSVGCIPITDEYIEQIYILALEANNNGQKKIPVHIFPQRLNSIPYLINTKWWPDIYKMQHNLWTQLSTIDNYFNEHQHLPKINVTELGYFIDHLK